jgi:hypothetical protein
MEFKQVNSACYLLCVFLYNQKKVISPQDAVGRFAFRRVYTMASDPNRIVFRDRQIFLRLFGVFWMLMSLFFLFNKESMVTGLVLLAIGLLIGFALPVSATIILDKTKGIVSARNWSLFSRSFKEYPLRDISSIEVEYRSEMHTSHKRGALSRLVVVTPGGEKPPLQTQFSNSTIANEFRASQMRKFLGVSGLQGPAVTPSQVVRQFVNRTNVPGQSAVAVQQGATLGVNWRLELATVGPTTVTHWISPDFTKPCRKAPSFSRGDIRRAAAEQEKKSLQYTEHSCIVSTHRPRGIGRAGVPNRF